MTLSNRTTLGNRMKLGEFFISATTPKFLTETPQRRTTMLPQIIRSNEDLDNPSNGQSFSHSDTHCHEKCRRPVPIIRKKGKYLLLEPKRRMGTTSKRRKKNVKTRRRKEMFPSDYAKRKTLKCKRKQEKIPFKEPRICRNQ